MGRRTRLTVGLLGSALLLASFFVAGCGGFGRSSESATVASGAVAPLAPESAPKSDGTVMGGAVGAPTTVDAAGTPVRSSQEPLIISSTPPLPQSEESP
jgi:hypothetical protein